MTAVFRGLSAFPITPADRHGRVDTGALGALLARLIEAKVDSIGLLGSTGTYAYLAREERRRAIDAAVAEVGGRIPIMVGIGALRTEDAVQLGRDAKAAGATAALLAPVSYTPLTEDEVFTHFETVAQAIDLPICIYDNPGTTHFTFSTNLIARLARVPGIVALKHPAPPADAVTTGLIALLAEVPAGFSVGFSTDWNAAEALIAGGDAWYSVLAGLFPAPCLEICAAVRRGDVAEARRLNGALQPIWDLFTRFSSLRVIYAAVNLLGLCKAEPPRPILPLADAARAEVAAVLRSMKLL